jgi:uncharacterized linocin/CFP29 family protein
MDILKRELAPLVPEAWKQVEDEARRTLRLNLAGRRVADVKGPYGWEYAAVNLGRLHLLKKQPAANLKVGVRQVQPLIEFRTPVTLDLMELDNVVRGAADVDLDPVIEAAERSARVEDDAIFNGYADGGITGIAQASPHKPIAIKSTDTYPHAVVEACEVLREAGIDGPYALVLSPQSFTDVSRATQDGYPIRKRIETQIIDGPLVYAPAVDGAIVLSIRGGDYELTIGQDLSVGYASHDRNSVELYLTESFTFRVLEPAAAVVLKAPKR